MDVSQEPNMIEICLTTQFVANNLNKKLSKKIWSSKGKVFTLRDVKNAGKSPKSAKICFSPQGAQIK